MVRKTTSRTSSTRKGSGRNSAANEVHKAIGYHANELKNAKDPAMKKHHGDALAKLSKLASGVTADVPPAANVARKPRGRPKADTSSASSSMPAKTKRDDMGNMDM